MSRRAPDDVERAVRDLPACETGETTALPASDDPAVPQLEIAGLPARFEIRRVVGRGGMGVVLAAYDRSLDREVAIKMIRLDRQDPPIRERFLREARAAASLRDRGIVQVHDIDPDGKYIVMELVHGESLGARLDRDGRLPAGEVMRIGRALAGALGVAHAAEVVHRDVKPSNILLDGTEVKLADFGVALFPDSELTAPGVQVGTPAYMAPEQLRGKEIDARADVYAAGATLYRAATGIGLHDRTRTRAIAADVFDATRDRVLADVIARAVRDDPAERFTDGRELRAALSGAPQIRRPAALVVMGIAAAAIVGAGAWYLARGRGSSAASTIHLVAVEPIRSTTWSYAAGPPNPDATGDVLAILVGNIDGFRTIGATELANGVEGGEVAARALEASDLVRGAIEQRGNVFHASIELRSLTASTTTRLEVDGATIPRLMNDIADQVAHGIDPRMTHDRGPTTQLARQLFARGEPMLARLDFDQARPFLDQAVEVDPSYFDAWYALASVRSWMMAPEAEVEQAIEVAYERAGPGPRKQLLEGASKFMHHEYPSARALLEPLVATSALGKFEQRDALYYLGEANWHDGRHAIAANYFRRALELDSRFKPPAIHLGEYALARRDHALAVYLGGILEEPSQDPYEFMQGHYEALLRSSTTRFRLYARLALGQTPPPEDVALAGDDPIYPVATALGDGQHAAARRSIDALWAPITANSRDSAIADSTYLQIKTLADVLLSAGAPEIEELRRCVTWMAERSKPHPVYGYQRLSILAAPLVRDRAWIVRDGLTERETRLADAIEAEMTGDRRRAAELLAALVADPTASWDYPERVALLRNLHALGRDRDARALCDDTLHPAVFAWAYLPTRRQCR